MLIYYISHVSDELRLLQLSEVYNCMYLRLIPIHVYDVRIIETFLIAVEVRPLFDVRNRRNEIILLKLYYIINVGTVND